MKKNAFKHSIVGLSGLVLLSMTANSVSAATEGTVNYKDGATTAWTSPEAGQKVDSYLAKDQKVSIASEKQVFGDKWYKLDNGTWVAAKYISTNGSAAKETTATPSTQNITVSYAAGAVTLWSDANSGVATGKYVFNGDKLAVKSTKTVYGSTWYQVDGGWVSSEFVSTNGQAAAQPAATTTPAAQPAATTTTTQATQTTQKSTPAASTPAAPSTSVNASGAISRAMAQIGKPYQWGASGPNAFDCSGLIRYALGIGGNAATQSSMGTMVSISALQPGDLVFWGGRGSAYHVALYIGNGQYVHATKPGDTVKVATISSYFMPSFGVRL
ncbi:hypothetical protein RD055328_03630 [Companilactobacillus sp. RD055328]|uniref:C40 family peptidase n=1 Tax=Companilactobacillus sp. RD055328 TaxID=2916634 RepID=UPI001FC8B098|nr:C40 family peptidase [Companilactobacillus sp. RD055328]GKQ42440.1 hypothetical protein RD055328_03630 [Companilactobacillus sp. RD055328]